MARQHPRPAESFGSADTSRRSTGRSRKVLERLRAPLQATPADAVRDANRAEAGAAALITALPQPSLPRLVRDRRGVAVIEMAAVAPVLLLMIVTFADFGRAMSQSIDINTALRAGAQHAVTAAKSSSQAGTTNALSQAEAVVRSALPSNLTAATVNTTCYCGVLPADSTDMPPVASCTASCPSGSARMMRLQAQVAFTPYNSVFGSLSDRFYSNGISGDVTIRTQ